MLFLLLNAQVGFAQDEIVAVPNRPTVSTTAQPVQRGVLETEWGVDAASSHQDVNGLFKFGLTTNSNYAWPTIRSLRIQERRVLATPPQDLNTA